MVSVTNKSEHIFTCSRIGFVIDVLVSHRKTLIPRITLQEKDNKTWNNNNK